MSKEIELLKKQIENLEFSNNILIKKLDFEQSKNKKQEKVFINRLVDSEEPNNNDYTYMYVTKKDCSGLIYDSVEFYSILLYEEENADNLQYLIEEYNINNAYLIEYLKHNLQNIDTDNGVITFVEDVLKYHDLLIDFEETEIKY